MGSSATRWGVNALILLGIILALYLGKNIFIPTVIALLLAAMLWPLATWMHSEGIPLVGARSRQGFPWLRPVIVRWRPSWGFATLAVVTGFIAFVIGVTFAFGLGLSKIFIDAGNVNKQEQVYIAVVKKLERLHIPLDNEYLPPNPIDPVTGEVKSQVFAAVRNFFDAKNPAFLSFAGWALGYGGTLLWESILIMFILLFLLLEGRMLSRRVVEIFGPSAVVQSKVVEALKEMANQVRAYLVWRTIINFAMAGLLGGLYHFLGLRLSWTWALLTSVLWYIPYLGPIAAGIPPILDAFISCDSPWVAVFILIFYVVWVVIEGYFVVPVVMGRSMEMNATTVMLACLFWEHVWGTVGLFLAMPLIAAVKAVCTHIPDAKPWANLMSSHDEPPETAPEDDMPRGDETHVDGAPRERSPIEKVLER
jgi:predicted PurR-regulated permease PerM